MLRVAGETFDGWLSFIPTAAGYASGLRTVHEAAVEAGRDPNSIATGVYVTGAVGDTARGAAGELDEYIRAYYGVAAQVDARTTAVPPERLEQTAGVVD